MGTIIGGGNTQALLAVNEKILHSVGTYKGSRDVLWAQALALAPTSHLVKLSLLNIFFIERKVKVLTFGLRSTYFGEQGLN